MGVRFAVIIKCQSWKTAVLEILMTVQVCSAGYRHDRCIFYVPWEITVFTNLNHGVRSASWWPSDRSHSHLNPWCYYVVSIAAKIASSIQFSTAVTAPSTSFLILSAITFFIFLIITCTSSIGCRPPKNINETIDPNPKVSLSATSALISLTAVESFKDSFYWLSSLCSDVDFLRVEIIFAATFENFRNNDINKSATIKQWYKMI